MQIPVIYETRIQPEWLDYNNHLNVAYYVLIFDLAGETLVHRLGMGQAVTRKTGYSWVVLENHVTYDREVTAGQSVAIKSQLLDHDHKRMHLYMEMHVTGRDGGYRAATPEQMVMCVDLHTRRSADFPKSVQSAIASLAADQAQLARPEGIGRRIGIRR